MPTTTEQRVAVNIRREGKDTFSVATADLPYIGAQLRAKGRFSVFNSIILPIMISVLTFLFTNIFQYISWRNSVRLQESVDRAARANATLEKTSFVIGQRYYATFLFVPTVRSTVNKKTGSANDISRLDAKLNESRFDGYYTVVKDWNENYDQILSRIDYDLDRPVLSQRWKEGVPISEQRFNSINCTKSLVDQLDFSELERFSLKVQFASINYCFRSAVRSLNAEKDKALRDKDAMISDAALKQADVDLYSLRAMASQFRCYALTRVEYFNEMKEKSIFSFTEAFLNLFAKAKVENSNAEHFKKTDERCKMFT